MWAESERAGEWGKRTSERVYYGFATGWMAQQDSQWQIRNILYYSQHQSGLSCLTGKYLGTRFWTKVVKKIGNWFVFRSTPLRRTPEERSKNPSSKLFKHSLLISRYPLNLTITWTWETWWMPPWQQWCSAFLNLLRLGHWRWRWCGLIAILWILCRIEKRCPRKHSRKIEIDGGLYQNTRCWDSLAVNEKFIDFFYINTSEITIPYCSVTLAQKTTRK